MVCRAAGGVKMSTIRKAYGILVGMKGGQKVGGFTIVETLIVLAVTGLLFVSAAAAISGRQNRTEFEQSVRQIHAQIQQTINEVSIGFYPSQNNFSCSAGASAPIISTGGPNQQGKNADCIFMGKVMQFQVGGLTPEHYAIYSLAGLRKTSAGADPASLAQAAPRAIAPSTSNPSWPNVTQIKPQQYGLTTAWMRYNNGSNQNTGAVAFVSSVSHYSSANGSQQVDLVPITNNTLGAMPNAMAETINTRIATSPVNPSGGVTICFASAGSNQSGLVTIGGNNRQLAATLKVISGNRTCS